MHRSCVVCVLVVDFDVEEIMEEFTMCMTNDIDKIREITGYEPGKASIYGFNEEQFDRTNKENINEDGICYPRTYQNHVNKLDKLIQDNKGKNFCYNPPVAYEAKEAEKAIVEKFVEFVKKCEEYDTK